MEGKQKISQREKTDVYYKYGKEFKNLPKGLNERDLLILTSEFKLGRLHNKDKFILAYTRLSIWAALKCAKYPGIAEEMVSVGLATLSLVPSEVKERLVDFNIVGYLISRIRTRCLEFARHNFVLYIPKDEKKLKQNHIRIKRQNIELDHIERPTNKVKDLKELIGKCLVTDLDTIIYKHREQGYTDCEIAQLLGCSQAKITKAKLKIEQRFEELRKEETN